MRTDAAIASVDPVAAAGEAAAADALRLWASDIYDPPARHLTERADRCRIAIDEMIRGPLGLGWGWEPFYSGNGAFAWCGAALSTFYGDRIPLAMRKTFWSSTYRLDRWARYQPIDERKVTPRPATGARMVVELDERSKEARFPDGSLPRAGDILLVGDGKRLAYGSHITMLLGYTEATHVFHAISGNGAGTGPDGKWREGVVKTDHVLGRRPRRLIRIGAADLAA